MFGTKVLEERTSKYNGDLKVIRTFGMGTYIQANGLTQSGGIVESIWRQTIRRLRSTKPIVNDSLILGFGGGTVSKLINRYWLGATIKGIDIDPIIVELGEKYLDSKNVKAEIKIGDAMKGLKSSKEKYDLIIVDLYNGDNYPEAFEGMDFVNLVKHHLKNDGNAIFNRLYYGDKRPMAVKFGNKLQETFKNVDWFYPEANLMFICSN